MTFPKGTIRLDAARAIFTGVEITEVFMGEKVVGYRAGFIEEKTGVNQFEETSLTALCRKLWLTASTPLVAIRN